MTLTFDFDFWLQTNLCVSNKLSEAIWDHLESFKSWGDKNYKNATLLKNVLSSFGQSVLQTTEIVPCFVLILNKENPLWETFDFFKNTNSDYQNHFKKTQYQTGQKFIKTYIVECFLIVLLLNLQFFWQPAKQLQLPMCFWSCVTYLLKRSFSVFLLWHFDILFSRQITKLYHYGYATGYEKAADANGWHHRLIILRKSLY